MQLCNIGVEFLETRDTNGNEGVGAMADMITNDLSTLKGEEKVIIVVKEGELTKVWELGQT